MSKLSQLHADLSEQASELGFENIAEAELNGYEVDLINGKLVEGRELAHKDYLKRKKGVLADLEELKRSAIEGGYQDEIDAIQRTIDFINEGEV